MRNMARLCTPDGKCLLCVQLAENKAESIIYSADGQRCISIADVVKTNKTSIHILLAKSDQVKTDTIKRNDFNFQCVQDITNAINSLNSNSKNLIKITPSYIDNLENSLTPKLGEFSDIELIMWGDHGGSPNEAGVTGVFASGNANDWIYVHYNTTRGHYLTKERINVNNGNPIAINLKLGIKLINYGCYGNVSHNRDRFNNVFKDFSGEENYLGKYSEQSKDRVITLDMISDLLAIGKTYAKKLNIEPEKLKEAFQKTLEEMEKRPGYIDKSELSNRITNIRERLKWH